MTRFPAVGSGGDAPTPIAFKDRAETFGESDVTTSATNTTIYNETVEPAYSVVSVSKSFSLTNVSGYGGEENYTVDLTGIGRIYADLNGSGDARYGEHYLRVDGVTKDTSEAYDPKMEADVRNIEGDANIEVHAEADAVSDEASFSGNVNFYSQEPTSSVTVEWPNPADVYRWDAAAFKVEPDGETVEVYVEESTDGGSTWTQVQGPVSRGDLIEADPDSLVRFRVDFEITGTGSPHLDSIYRRWVV